MARLFHEHSGLVDGDDIPKPKYALGIDKASLQLLDEVRGVAERAGLVFGPTMYEQDRHYIHPVSSGDRTKYLFFDWYDDGRAWTSDTIWGAGEVCLQDHLVFEAENQCYVPVNREQSLVDAFVAGMKAAFSGGDAAAVTR